jgi:putative intracellular protease/amidase
MLQPVSKYAALVLSVLCTVFASHAYADLQRQKGLLAEGTVWETAYYSVDSGEVGPRVLVVGGLHGNEPAGYRAAEQIRHWTIGKGSLLVVPRANVPGIETKSRWLPGEDKSVRNANRNFPQQVGDEAKTVPVRALWDFVVAQDPDWVVDLHEGFDFRVANPDSDGSSLIYFGTPEMERIAASIHEAVNVGIDDAERQFVKLSKSGPVPGGLVRASVEVLGAKGFCFETTYEQQPLSLRTRQQRLMVHTLLRELGMEPGDRITMTSAAEPSVTRVAVYDAGGTGGSGVENLERIGPEDLREGVLDQFDVVVFPGGSGSKQAAAVGDAGLRSVSAFVRKGGGYVGICAGAFLAAANYDWSLALLDAKTFTGNREIPGVGTRSMWFRGTGAVTIELTDAGREILGDIEGEIALRYANGPILSPAGREELPAYVPLAYFRSEISKYPPQEGTMIHAPAIVAAELGAGRVLAISPHPEATEGLEDLVRRAVAWAAGVEQPATRP